MDLTITETEKNPNRTRRTSYVGPSRTGRSRDSRGTDEGTISDLEGSGERHCTKVHKDQIWWCKDGGDLTSRYFRLLNR